jgi:hypothetical protein
MSRRLRWISLAALGALAAIALVAVGPATATKVTKVKSTVTIKLGEGAKFTGKVSAGQKSCRSKRKVELFMEPYSGDEDELVGTARTDSTGAWQIKGSFMAGIYHAEVKSRFVNTDAVILHCLFAVGMSARY